MSAFSQRGRPRKGVEKGEGAMCNPGLTIHQVFLSSSSSTRSQTCKRLGVRRLSDRRPLLPVALVRGTELILRRSVAIEWGCAESKANDRSNRGYRRDIRMAGVGKIRARKEG